MREAKKEIEKESYANVKMQIVWKNGRQEGGQEDGLHRGCRERPGHAVALEMHERKQRRLKRGKRYSFT